MATRIATHSKSGAKNATSIKDSTKTIVELYNKLEDKDKLDILSLLGCGTDFFTCQRCGSVKSKKRFYISTESSCVSGYTHICKDCAEEIAMPTINGEKTAPDKNTVDKALYALNKPFLDVVWESSML